MERIYLDCLQPASENGIVKVAVFLKDVSNEHFNDLIGFLGNQNITCYEISDAERQKIQALSYFDEGFIIEFSAKRWSFFRLRSYLRNCLNTWQKDVMFFGDYFKDVKSRDTELNFDDSFYVELSRLIDQCEDNYYIGTYSIGLFLNGILRILKENLQLYWAAAQLENFQTGKLAYLNYVPPSIPVKKITSACSKDSSKSTRVFPVVFCNEHIANFIVCPGPFSPEKQVIDKFVGHVLMHIDDFIYSDINFRKQIFRLKSNLADVEKENTILRNKLSEFDVVPIPADDFELPMQTKMLEDVRLILIGDTKLKRERLLVEFKRVGFDKQKVELHIEYDKMKQIKINDLTRIRSRYDGIILGPMPHIPKGTLRGQSLIGMMENNTQEYPPFVVCKERSGTLKITNNSLKSALNELIPKIDNYNNYRWKIISE